MLAAAEETLSVVEAAISLLLLSILVIIKL
jgi:hypothetical protein